MNPIVKELTRLKNAFFYSMAGFKAAFESEPAFRLEVYLLGPALLAAFYLGESALEQALLIGSVFLVLICEILNSAFEATIDRISSDRHPLSGKVKDLGSAAVLLALTNAFIIWLVVLL